MVRFLFDSLRPPGSQTPCVQAESACGLKGVTGSLRQAKGGWVTLKMLLSEPLDGTRAPRRISFREGESQGFLNSPPQQVSGWAPSRLHLNVCYRGGQ